MLKKPVIVFEGIEGSGKSYHISNVSKFLKKKKIDHIMIFLCFLTEKNITYLAL